MHLARSLILIMQGQDRAVRTVLAEAATSYREAGDNLALADTLAILSLVDARIGDRPKVWYRLKKKATSSL